jgi:hypothetical protein
MSQVASLTEGFPFSPNLKALLSTERLALRRISVSGKELNAVPFKNGDIFECTEEREDVMVDTVRVKDGNLFIKLVSLDKTFEGNPIEYEVSEQMLKKYYNPTDRRQPFLETAAFSTCMGE